MATVRGEGLLEQPNRDQHRLVLGVPAEVPFTAASINATLQALQVLIVEGSASVSWDRRSGLCFVLPNDDEHPIDQEALYNLEIPLRVLQAEFDKSVPDVLFIDTNSMNDDIVVLRPEQAFTVQRLNELVDGWIQQDPGLAGDWQLCIENNCLTLCNSEAARLVLSSAIKPIYEATGHAIVRIPYDSRLGRMCTATVTVRITKQQRSFVPSLEATCGLAYFLDVRSVRAQAVTATYESSTLFELDPLELLKGLEVDVVHFMYTLGIHPQLSGELKVVLDQSHRTPGGSHDNDLHLAQRFPIRRPRR